MDTDIVSYGDRNVRRVNSIDFPFRLGIKTKKNDLNMSYNHKVLKFSLYHDSFSDAFEKACRCPKRYISLKTLDYNKTKPLR